MKRELKGSSGGNLGDAREGIARPIPMKRELKGIEQVEFERPRADRKAHPDEKGTESSS